VNRQVEGVGGYPLAGPLVSSGVARYPRAGGWVWPVAPMTFYVPSVLSFFLSFASPSSPWRLLPAPCGDGGCGGEL
jgi:hypothetical protein